MSLTSSSPYGRFATALPLTFGKTFFVHASGSVPYVNLGNKFQDDEDGVPRVHTTIAAAVARCTASAGDIVYVLPGHTETLTAALTLNVAGVSVIGLGNGMLRPTLNVNGVIDGVNITAANVLFENFHFGVPGTDAQTACINVAGVAGVTIRNITGIGSTTAINVVDMITVAASSNDLVIEDVKFTNATVPVNSFLSIEGACSRVTLKNLWFYGDCVTAGIIDGAAVTHLFMEDVRVGTVGTSIPAITLDSNPTGLARNCFFSGTHTTLATNANLGNAMRVDNIKVLEETDNSRSAAIIPAVDAD